MNTPQKNAQTVPAEFQSEYMRLLRGGKIDRNAPLPTNEEFIDFPRFLGDFSKGVARDPVLLIGGEGQYVDLWNQAVVSYRNIVLPRQIARLVDSQASDEELHAEVLRAQKIFDDQLPAMIPAIRAKFQEEVPVSSSGSVGNSDLRHLDGKELAYSMGDVKSSDGFMTFSGFLRKHIGNDANQILLSIDNKEYLSILKNKYRNEVIPLEVSRTALTSLSQQEYDTRVVKLQHVFDTTFEATLPYIRSWFSVEAANLASPQVRGGGSQQVESRAKSFFTDSDKYLLGAATGIVVLIIFGVVLAVENSKKNPKKKSTMDSSMSNQVKESSLAVGIVAPNPMNIPRAVSPNAMDGSFSQESGRQAVKNFGLPLEVVIALCFNYVASVLYAAAFIGFMSMPLNKALAVPVFLLSAMLLFASIAIFLDCMSVVRKKPNRLEGKGAFYMAFGMVIGAILWGGLPEGSPVLGSGVGSWNPAASFGRWMPAIIFIVSGAMYMAGNSEYVRRKNGGVY